MTNFLGSLGFSLNITFSRRPPKSELGVSWYEYLLLILLLYIITLYVIKL